MARPFEHTKPSLRTWGHGRAQVLILPGAGQGPGCWESVGSALAGQGVPAACLEYPGHGQAPWQLPPSTGLHDYKLLAARATAGLGRPILVGHDLGGWLAQRILGLAEMPALLLAPWPGQGPGLLFASPALGWDLLWGRPRAQGLVAEPLRLRWQAALAWSKPVPPPKGGAPRLVAAPGRDPLIAPNKLAALAHNLKAELVSLPDCGHDLWQEPEVVLRLVGRLAANL